MSVILSNLDYYGCANMPEADGSTVGGAVDFSKKVTFSDISPTGTVDYVSDSASDTATIIEVEGRDSTGATKTETKTLTGTTVVTGSQSFERLLFGAASGAGTGGPLANPGGTSAAGNVAAISHTPVVSAHTMQAGSANSTASAPAIAKLQSGDGASVAIGQIIRTTGGTGPNQIRQIVAINPGGLGADFVAVNADWSVVPDATTTYNVHQGMYFAKTPNQVTAVIRAFATATADVGGGSTRVFNEKIFAVNNNTTIALTVAAILKEVDPAGLYTVGGALDFALTSVLNDTGTVANRQTAPASGITAYSSGAAPQSINVPSPQNLPSGAAPNAAGAQGVWLKLTLPAGAAAAKGSFTMRQTGSST